MGCEEGSEPERARKGGPAAPRELRLLCFLRLREFLEERRPRRGQGLGEITLRMLLDGFIF